METIIKNLYERNMILFSSDNDTTFTLKNGETSSFYINLRNICSHRDVLKDICEHIYKRFLHSIDETYVLCGVPYGGIHYATYLSYVYQMDYLIKRKEKKTHGLKNSIDGDFTNNTYCVLIEDVITTGSSVLKTIKEMESQGIKIIKIIAIVCRNTQSLETIRDKGYEIDALITSEHILSMRLFQSGDNNTNIDRDHSFRINALQNPLAKEIYALMVKKQTNIALSLDIENKSGFLEVLEGVAEHICILKTHIDIIEQYDDDFISAIKNIQKQHSFFILEDRKFSDIGNTVKKQITGGIYNINRWADCITAHGIAGSSIIDIYADINKANEMNEVNEAYKNKGIVFVSEMSNSGNLMTHQYTQSIAEMCANKQIVLGFVCQKRMSNNKFLYLTPGVSTATEQKKDHIDQNYRTPETAILQDHCDIIIVGRAIYKSKDPVSTVVELKERSWKLYNHIKK